MIIICHLLEIAVISQLRTTDGRSGHSSKNVKEQNMFLVPRSLFLMHPVGKFRLQMWLYTCIQREAMRWHCLNKQKLSCLLRIVLPACVWPESKIYNLKLMHPANPISNQHSALAALLETAQLQVPCAIPAKDFFLYLI